MTPYPMRSNSRARYTSVVNLNGFFGRGELPIHTGGKALLHTQSNYLDKKSNLV